MQSGAYKSKLPFVAYIGVLKFPKAEPMLKLIIDKINTRRKDARFVDNMRVFQQVLKNNPNAKHVVDPVYFARYLGGIVKNLILIINIKQSIL